MNNLSFHKIGTIAILILLFIINAGLGNGKILGDYPKEQKIKEYNSPKMDYLSKVADLFYGIDLGRIMKDLTAEYPVTIKFSIKRSGRIKNIKVEKTSGNKDVDSVAIAILKNLEILPPFPQNLKEEEIELGINLVPPRR